MKRRVSPLLLLLFLGMLVTYIRDKGEVPQDVDPAPTRDDCGLAGCAGVPAGELPQAVLSEAEACQDVGYLCAELEQMPSFRILRWPTNTDRIRVRIPLPANEEDPNVARELQGAAARGVMRWSGSPFTIVTDTRRRSQEPADIMVQWVGSLGGNQLGVTRREWKSNGGRTTLSVSQFALVTRSPRNGERRLDPNQVFLTAAHEMGHALGLPHSDESRDVMFPTNTARALTNRDHRTMAALYATPNGAEIRRDR